MSNHNFKLFCSTGVYLNCGCSYQSWKTQ